MQTCKPLQTMLVGSLAMALGLCCPSVTAAETAEQDIIVLTNSHRFEGTVVGDTNGDFVTIRTEGGLLRFSRSMIDTIEQALHRRRANLTVDDYQGHVDLAHWAISRDERQVALELMQAVAEHKHIDAAGLALLAQLTDEMVDWQSALDYYRRYRKKGGRDVGLLQRLAQLEKFDRKYQRRVSKYQKELANRTINEGLETTQRWRVEDPRWANPAQTDVVEIPDSGGDHVLRVRFEGGDDNNKKAAIGWREMVDVRKWKHFHLDINNGSEDSLAVSIAVKAGNWEYYESPAVTIPEDSNWHAVDVDLTAPIFKCEKDNWASYSHTIANTREIREIQIQIHNGQNKGVLFLNNIGFLTEVPE